MTLRISGWCTRTATGRFTAAVRLLGYVDCLSRVPGDWYARFCGEGVIAISSPYPTTYRRILDYCRAWRANGPLVVGVTATPERGDRHSLREGVDRIVYQKNLLEVMQAGSLVDLRALQVLFRGDFHCLAPGHGGFVEGGW